MIAVKPITCPQCGGETGFKSGVVSFECRRCGVKLAVCGEMPIAAYSMEPIISQKQASINMREAFKDPEVSRGLISDSHLISISLIYIPFIEIHTRRIGKLTFGNKSEKVQTYYVMTKDTRETTISINDTYCALPLSTIPNLGMEQLNFSISDWKKDGLLGTAKLQQANLIEMKQSAYVLEPPGNMDDIIKRVDERYGKYYPLGGNLKEIDKKYRILYYPVYLGKYLYCGCTYPVLLSAINGNILYAIAPQRNVLRPLAAILPALIASLVITSFLKGNINFENISLAFTVGFLINFMHVILIFGSFALGLILMILSFFWIELRYKGIVYFYKDSRKVILKANKPKKTKLEKVSEAIFDFACDVMHRPPSDGEY